VVIAARNVTAWQIAVPALLQHERMYPTKVPQQKAISPRNLPAGGFDEAGEAIVAAET
jgi:hypothetical protein